MKATEDVAPGVLLVDKPEGPTSHDVVAAARRALGTRRVGHTGTLDPFASGLLILCIGKATRLAEFYHLLPKRYRAMLTLGRETDTDDLTGQETHRSEAWKVLDRADMMAATAARTGRQLQVPPFYSARKIDGRRAHRMARAGEQVELAPSEITVHSIQVTEWAPPALALELWVSTGTYVRALARDIGRDLGCGAHLASLRRTAIGPFEVEQAFPGSELSVADEPRDIALPILSPLEALGWLPRRDLTDDEEIEVSFGRAVPEPTVTDPPMADLPIQDLGNWPVVLTRNGEVVALARRESGLLLPVKVLRAA